MKKLFLMALLSLLLSSCSDDEKDDNIETFTSVGLVDRITVSDVQNILNSVFEDIVLVARYHMPNDPLVAGAGEEGWFDNRFMLRMPYDAEGFTLQFPANPPSELMWSIDKDIPEGFTISNPEARTISFVEIGCCSKDSERVGGQIRLYKDAEATYYRVVYLYCDRPVKITGESTDWWSHPAVYDLKLEKGWNMVVEKREYRDSGQFLTVNNQMPSGMYWSYDMWIGGR